VPSPGRTNVWDLATGKELWGFDGDRFLRFAFSPDGRHLAALVPDDVKGMLPAGYELCVRDAATGEVILRRKGVKGLSGSISSVVYDPSGKHLAVAYALGDAMGERNLVSLLDASTGEVRAGPLSGHRGSGVRAMVFSQDGRRLFTRSSAEIKVWDTVSGRELLNLNVPSEDRFRVQLGLSADGHRLFSLEGGSGSPDVAIRTWDATPLPDEGPAKEGGR
jgi:WD40 repeat protein